MNEQIRLALKSPLTYALIIITGVATYFVTAYNNRSDDSLHACNAQIDYLKLRVDKLEKQLDEYTKAVMFKDAQVKNRDQVIDSLKMEGIK
ncbi:hypothetical protein [Sphingobacterium sp. 1.A.4]|uniref:hypothetical protein n=1 Tax=Sphingobacterium sp. 1.A.4 TaxID=2044603 RepID=UPI000C0BD5CE|nr:hypothetical protein [Sphingobacterium sp. 1.A.4]